MKKKLVLLLLIVAILPLKVFAKNLVDDYQTLGLKDTLTAEGFTLENKDYKETDDQAIIYMFRGQGCGYCRAFLEFLNSISKEYGKYFKLVSFEVWNDAKNAELFNKVPMVTNEQAGGVPYIIIGEKVFSGYTSDYDEGIKQAIMNQYNDNSYDVMEKLDELLNGNNGGSTSTFAVVFWNAFFIVAATVAIILVNNKNTQRIIDSMGAKKASKK